MNRFTGQNLTEDLQEYYGIKRKNDETDWELRKRSFVEILLNQSIHTLAGFEFLFGRSHSDFTTNDEGLMDSCLVGTQDKTSLVGFAEGFSSDPREAMFVNVVKEVKRLDFSFGQYVVVGTGIMAVLGIKNTDDVDLVVVPNLFERLRQSGEWEEFKKSNGGPALRKGNVEAYLDVNYGSHNPTSEELISRAVVIQGIPFITLSELLKFKKEYKRTKDFHHIKLIEEFSEKERGITMGQEDQQLHIHPERNTIFGIRLRPGCVLKETDVYASSSGTWEKCPCPGVTLRKTDVVWVRPTMEV